MRQCGQPTHGSGITNRDRHSIAFNDGKVFILCESHADATKTVIAETLAMTEGEYIEGKKKDLRRKKEEGTELYERYMLEVPKFEWTEEKETSWRKMYAKIFLIKVVPYTEELEAKYQEKILAHEAKMQKDTEKKDKDREGKDERMLQWLGAIDESLSDASHTASYLNEWTRDECD